MKQKLGFFLFGIVLILLVVGYFLILRPENSKLKTCNNRVHELEDLIEVEKNKPEPTCTNVVINQSKVLPSSVLLNIPSYSQKYSASCEAAATHSAMLYFGVNISEDKILNTMGKDESPRYFDSHGNLHWGNPQQHFVGNWNAKHVYVDGYGVYNKPVYQVLKVNGFEKSISKTGWNLNDLYDYVKMGYPAIVWISSDFKKQTVGKMIASDGTENLWMYKEHAVVIRGVDNSNVYYMDVWSGKNAVVTKSTFATGFANLNNMAIVVVPND